MAKLSKSDAWTKIVGKNSPNLTSKTSAVRKYSRSSWDLRRILMSKSTPSWNGARKLVAWIMLNWKNHAFAVIRVQLLANAGRKCVLSVELWVTEVFHVTMSAMLSFETISDPTTLANVPIVASAPKKLTAATRWLAQSVETNGVGSVAANIEMVTFQKQTCLGVPADNSRTTLGAETFSWKSWCSYYCHWFCFLVQAYTSSATWWNAAIQETVWVN